MHLKMAYADEPTSLECINKSDLFPKKKLVREDDSLQVPTPLLPGEAAEFLGKTTDGVIVLSNYRLLITFKASFVNVPIGMIDSVERTDIFFLNIYCKDATVARCGFSDNDACQAWFLRISAKLNAPKQLNEFFAFTFHAWCQDRNPGSTEPENCFQLCQKDESCTYSFGKEVERQKFDLKSGKAWRITYINEDFNLCPTYPKNHIVPASITDEDIKSSAGFRALKRFPSVVWRNQRNGAVLVRCSQPEIGFFNWRNTQDENLMKAYIDACQQNPGKSQKKLPVSEDSSGSESGSQSGDDLDEADKKVVIIDCRSYRASMANRLKGGGVECVEYYTSCEIQFMNLDNIHAIRKAFTQLRQHCSTASDQLNWLSGLEGTKWMTYLSNLLRTASLVVNVMSKEGRSVVVHCSDGWDRTSQIVALAELMMDPYYRTIEGFQVLVEREWLEFGHKFGDRCGNGVNCEDPNERSPVFLQWLDCVYQLYKQFPCAFQFNEAYLIKLVQHTYSHLFGTFLCNTVQDRLKGELSVQTSSVWSLLHPSNTHFYNHLYRPNVDQQVLRPKFDVRGLALWTSVYFSNYSCSTDLKDLGCDQPEIQQETTCGNLQKTRSCENLAGSTQEAISSPSRRKSDPSITLDNFDPSLLTKDCDKTSSNTCVSNGTVVSEDSHIDSEKDSKTLIDNGQNGDISVNGLVTNGLNGHCSDLEENLTNGKNENHRENGAESPEENGLVSEQCNGNSRFHQEVDVPSTSQNIECSTDTLTDTEGKPSEKCELQINGSKLEPKLSLEQIKTLEKSASISTSTSDISNSSVDLKLPVDNVYSIHRYLYRSTPLRLSCNSNGSIQSRSTYKTSPTTPANSRSSTCPPTPATDKSIDSQFGNKMGRLSRHLDADGLTTFSDPVQQGIQKIKEDYEREIQMIRSHLAAANAALLQHASACSGGVRCILDKEEMLLSPDVNGDFNSLGSNAASDVSWENIDESESKMIRWVPDHAVTHCAECEAGFSLLVRKHHCRNCGNIFCGNCSENFITIPQQNLMTPERVCNRCFSHHQMMSKHAWTANGVVDERPLAYAASN
ncbi:myotubularin-related protein 4-like [Saccostrea cucullata]|uniref:myotubularin-related protein 4-like n=1 Tax=Saccostrea cuccullata TaxID=36930 RepID=UPI002ED14482